MRMWMVDPSKLCRKHLLGEHVECHMFVGTINRHKSLTGFFNNKLVIVEKIEERHEQLAKEMQARGMKHKSKLPAFKITKDLCGGIIDVDANIKDLKKRCPECRILLESRK